MSHPVFLAVLCVCLSMCVWCLSVSLCVSLCFSAGFSECLSAPARPPLEPPYQPKSGLISLVYNVRGKRGGSSQDAGKSARLQLPRKVQRVCGEAAPLRNAGNPRGGSRPGIALYEQGPRVPLLISPLKIDSGIVYGLAGGRARRFKTHYFLVLGNGLKPETRPFLGFMLTLVFCILDI